ncbi:MAG TPA: CDP-diacylglycerol--serine O-phosphatidyltransferase [Candidatus Sumerlaeota bacterium]|nr:CDP-diacylglycerol--serine O-phosphatidyltransferase [Candidatus Sumerlaeota bacterium]HOR27745.1 CDP-diacylglycerol--serine O-phosphatidyltransferase [Candidatus Sumerlaeota bacterium]
MRKVFILPNLFTASSLFSGMLGIFEVFQGHLAAACGYILLSALLDVFDGLVARLTKTQSAFGLNFDSLSDVVAFGAAPGLMAFSVLSAFYPRLAAPVASLFTVCGALRLARFNVQATREESKAFLGLPIPGAALAAISLIWLVETKPELRPWLPLDKIYPPAMVGLAYLMVSKVPYVGFKSLNLADRQPFEILVAIVVVITLLFMVKEHLLLVGASFIWLYVLGGVFFALMRPIRRRRYRAYRQAMRARLRTSEAPREHES